MGSVGSFKLEPFHALLKINNGTPQEELELEDVHWNSGNCGVKCPGCKGVSRVARHHISISIEILTF